MDRYLDRQSDRQIDGLRDIETDKKQIRDFNYSSESQSVKDNESLKKLRYFTVENEKLFFDNHLKFSSHRIYFIERDDKIYIGYIGKHLPTKKYQIELNFYEK